MKTFEPDDDRVLEWAEESLKYAMEAMSEAEEKLRWVKTHLKAAESNLKFIKQREMK